LAPMIVKPKVRILGMHMRRILSWYLYSTVC
jgi:hypothetical protein